MKILKVLALVLMTCAIAPKLPLGEKPTLEAAQYNPAMFNLQDFMIRMNAYVTATNSGLISGTKWYIEIDRELVQLCDFADQSNPSTIYLINVFHPYFYP